MSQNLLIKIIRLSSEVLKSYVQRMYFKAKMLILGKKLQKEKEDARKAVEEAKALSDDFDRQYREYKRKRAERLRSDSGQVRANSKGSKTSN